MPTVWVGSCLAPKYSTSLDHFFHASLIFKFKTGSNQSGALYVCLQYGWAPGLTLKYRNSTDQFFHASVIFKFNADPTQVKHFELLHSMGELLAFLINIGLP